jgi:hypothetical protein
LCTSAETVGRDDYRVARVGKRWWFGMALSPNETSLLYSVVEHVSSNLMLVEKAW